MISGDDVGEVVTNRGTRATTKIKWVAGNRKTGPSCNGGSCVREETPTAYCHCKNSMIVNTVVEKMARHNHPC